MGEHGLVNYQSKKHVLIVDDGLDIQDLLRTILESKGHAVDCASNGAEALDMLSPPHELPDMILLDLRMPVLDGLGFLSLQRKSPRLRDIPIVAMSAEGDVESTRLKTKVKDVLMKPLNMSSVIEAVEAATTLS